MAKKLQSLENKLGSWTDQAALTRTAPQPVTEPTAVAAPPTAEPVANMRQTYPVARSLLDRIAITAAQHGLRENEVVGYLLTWALDQVDQGASILPPVAPTTTPQQG